MKFFIINFGCKVNQYQGELLRETLLLMDFEEVKPSQAQMIFVNGCLVTETAKTEAMRIARKYSEKARVILTGCAGVKDSTDFETIAPNNLQKLSELLGFKINIPLKIDHFKGHTRPIVLVQLGCNNYCTYCIVPYLRGGPVCRPQDYIIQEVETLADQGHKEIVLCGTELGQRKDLLDLLCRLSNIEGIERIRLSSINPKHLTAGLVNEILDIPKVASHLHLPLQSGSNKVLSDMKRGYTREHFLDLCHAAREKCPHVGITTDIIVGYPTETEDDFKETLNFMRCVKFARSHIFPFSSRPGTLASNLTPIKRETVDFRAKSARSLALHLANDSNHAIINSLQEVLIEENNKGFCGSYLQVKILGGAPKGSMVHCQIIRYDGRILIGEKR